MSEESEEYCKVHEKRIYKARKPHKCSACGVDILPGHYYASIFALGDYADVFKRCGSCEKTWQHLYDLCVARNKARPYELAMYPLEDLSCGKSYEEEWDAFPPDEIEDLPFLSPDERGALLKP